MLNSHADSEARSSSGLQFERDIALEISGYRRIGSSTGRERNWISDIEDVALTIIVSS